MTIEGRMPTEESIAQEPIVERSELQTIRRIQALREELDKLGYHIVKKDHIRKFGANKAISNAEWFRMDDEMRGRLQLRTIAEMARALGQKLVDSGAIKWGMETHESYGRCYRIEAVILLRDPQFDKPQWIPDCD